MKIRVNIELLASVARPVHFSTRLFRFFSFFCENNLAEFRNAEDGTAMHSHDGLSPIRLLVISFSFAGAPVVQISEHVVPSVFPCIHFRSSQPQCRSAVLGQRLQENHHSQSAQSPQRAQPQHGQGNLSETQGIPRNKKSTFRNAFCRAGTIHPMWIWCSLKGPATRRSALVEMLSVRFLSKIKNENRYNFSKSNFIWAKNTIHCVCGGLDKTAELHLK